MELKIEGVKIETVGYEGSVFTDYTVERYPSHGPGWYVKGHNKDKYGFNATTGLGNYVKVCAYPDKPKTKAKFYSCLVHKGFRTRKEAQAVADEMNRQVEELRNASDAK